MAEKKMKVPFIPILKGDNDVSNFAEEFTNCSLESHTESIGDCNNFEGFSFERSKESPPLLKGMTELKESDSDGEVVLV